MLNHINAKKGFKSYIIHLAHINGARMDKEHLIKSSSYTMYAVITCMASYSSKEEWKKTWDSLGDVVWECGEFMEENM